MTARCCKLEAKVGGIFGSAKFRRRVGEGSEKTAGSCLDGCKKCESFLHRCTQKRGRKVPAEGTFLSSKIYDSLTDAGVTKGKTRSQSSPERRGEHRNERSEAGAQPRNLADRPKDGGTKRSHTDTNGSRQGLPPKRGGARGEARQAREGESEGRPRRRGKSELATEAAQGAAAGSQRTRDERTDREAAQRAAASGRRSRRPSATTDQSQPRGAKGGRPRTGGRGKAAMGRERSECGVGRGGRGRKRAAAQGGRREAGGEGSSASREACEQGDRPSKDEQARTNDRAEGDCGRAREGGARPRPAAKQAKFTKLNRSLRV